MRKFLLALCVSFLSFSVAGQEAAVAPVALVSEGPKLTSELLGQERGGTARIGFTVTASGVVEDVHVLGSSGTPAFDELAAEAVEAWTFKPARNAAGEAIDVKMMAPIAFTTPKELQAGVAAHLSDQLGQTCAEFLVEVDSARPSAPEELPNAVSSFQQVWGAGFGALLVSGDKPGVIVAMAKAKKPLFDDVVDTCRASPEASFGDTFKASLGEQLSLARSEG